jgi:hypothetical protein
MIDKGNFRSYSCAKGRLGTGLRPARPYTKPLIANYFSLIPSMYSYRVHDLAERSIIYKLLVFLLLLLLLLLS